jgi:hypothetical protein
MENNNTSTGFIVEWPLNLFREGGFTIPINSLTPRIMGLQYRGK